MFKILAVDSRVMILNYLKDHPYCVNALARRLGISQGAVSQHLRIMRDAGLVIDEKQGYFVHYRLNRDTLAQWKLLTNDLFAGDKDYADENGD